MKTARLILLLCCLLLLGTACSKQDFSSPAYVSPVQMESPSPAEPTVPVSEAPNGEAPGEIYIPEQIPQSTAAPCMDIDVDLTVMSSTMVYSEVYNMIMFPDEYVGKTIKVKGQYYNAYSEDTQQYYHFVVVADATVCCQQGLEFVWNGEHDITEYPKRLSEIEIVGAFGLYNEQENIYCYLTVDSIQVL